MILEILGVAAALKAFSNAKKANEIINYANQLNEETSLVVDPALADLDRASCRLLSILYSVKGKREEVLFKVVENFIYYVKHINSNISKKNVYPNELEKIRKTAKNYVDDLENLRKMNINSDSILMSAAAGGLVLGAGAIGANVLGTSVSLGLGLSFFGVGSLLMSSYRLSQSHDYLESSKYLHDNRYALRSEIEDRTRIIDLTYYIFVNYNSELEKLNNDFKGCYKDIQRIYREGIIKSKENIKLIAKGEPASIIYEECSEEDQKAIYRAFEKCKVLAEFARKKLADSNGRIV